jgi:hypothetical protein
LPAAARRHRSARRLYSNPGEIVFSPFTGIGSEGYTALQARAAVLRVRVEGRILQGGVPNVESPSEFSLDDVESLQEIGDFGGVGK